MAITEQDFALRVKKKYPEYKDLDNKELVTRVLNKYPEYKEQITVSGDVLEPSQPAVAVAQEDKQIPEEDVGIIQSVYEAASDFASQANNIIPNTLNLLGDAGNLPIELAAKTMDWFVFPESRDMGTPFQDVAPEPFDFKPLFVKAGIATEEEADSLAGYAGKFTGEALAFNALALKGATAIRNAEKMLNNPASRGVAKNMLLEIQNDFRKNLGKFIATEGGAVAGVAGSQEALDDADLGTGTKLLLEVISGLGGAVTGRALASAPEAFSKKFGKLTVNELKAGVAKGDITYKDLEWLPMLRQEAQAETAPAPATPKATYEKPSDVPKYYEDIPTDDYVETKIRQSKEKGLNEFGMVDQSSVTGGIDTIRLPLSQIENLRGRMGEHEFVNTKLPYDSKGQAKVDALAKELVRDGKFKSKPLIGIFYDGRPQIIEGNHRIAAAIQEGIPIDVEIRYFDGSNYYAKEGFKPSELGNMALDASSPPKKTTTTALEPTMPGIVEESKVFNEVKREFTNALERKAIADTIAATNSINAYTPSQNPLIRAAVSVLKAVAPSKIAGRQNVLDIDKARGLITAAEKTGSIVRSKIEQFTGKGRFRVSKPEVESKVNDYLNGGEMDPDLEPIRPFLEKYRDTRNQLSEELLKALDDDAVSMLSKEAKENLFETIRQSIDENSYNSREYRIFTDTKFTPSSAQRKKAEIEIAESLRNSMDITYDEALSLASKQLDYLVGRSARTAKAKPGGYVPRAFDGPIRRKDLTIGPEQRKFLGEITEPGERIFGTLSRQSRLLAAREMDLAVARNLLNEGLATTVPTPSNNIQLPLATADGPSGIYVSDEVASSVSKLRMGETVTRSNNEVLNALTDTWNTLVGVSKATKVLLNVISYAPAAYGNAAMSAASAIFSPVDLKRGITLALSEFGPIRNFITNKNGKVARSLLDDIDSMSKYNLNTQGIVASDIRDSFRRSLVSKIAEKTLSPFSKAYSVLDVGFRYMTWKGNQRQLSKMFPNATEEQIRQSAAALTNDTFQQYDKVSNAFKTLSRIGFVNPFGTYGAEIVRNMYNQGKYAGQMAKGTFGKEIGLNPATANVSEMKKIGAKRIAALTTVGAGTTVGIRTLNDSKGIDLESEREFNETIAPFYDATKQLVIIPDNTGRSGTYFNPSYLVPQTIGSNAFMAGLKGKSLESAMDSIIDEFIGEGSFVFQALGQISLGRDERGKEISLSAEEADILKAKAKLFYKLVLEPSSFREADKWEKAIKDVGTLDEFKLIGRLLGLRYNSWDAKKSGISKFREASSKMQEAKSRYSYVRDNTNKLPAEKESTYNQMNSDRKSQFNEIMKHYNNLSGGTWKFTMDERIDMMKEAGLPSDTILDLLDGQYVDMPKEKTFRTSDFYEQIKGDKKQIENTIRQTFKTDPQLAKRLRDHHKRILRVEERNLSARDKLLLGLDTDKRIRRLYDMGVRPNNALYKEYVRIISRDVAQGIKILDRGY